MQSLHNFHEGSVRIGGNLLSSAGEEFLHAIAMRPSWLHSVGVEQGLRAKQVLFDVHALQRRYLAARTMEGNVQQTDES